VLVTSRGEGKGRLGHKHKKTRTTETQIFISITLNVKSKTILGVLYMVFRFGLSNVTVAYSGTCFRVEDIPIKPHMIEIVNVTKETPLRILHNFKQLTISVIMVTGKGVDDLEIRVCSRQE
jgi:hypothetical protein